jgi:hypothetical protein
MDGNIQLNGQMEINQFKTQTIYLVFIQEIRL